MTQKFNHMLTINIIRSCSQWRTRQCASKPSIKSIVSKVLTKFPNINSAKEVEVTILLTDNKKMQSLNNEFLGKNKPTNVLSFPDDVRNYKTILELNIESDYINLGDIAFGYEILEEEAASQAKEFEHHFAHLLVHGMLHLLGFDHMINEESEAMQTVEIEVLRELSISSPY